MGNSTYFFCCKVLILMIYLFPWGDRALYPLLNLSKFIKVVFSFSREKHKLLMSFSKLLHLSRRIYFLPCFFCKGIP